MFQRFFSRRRRTDRRLTVQPLQSRCVMAASLGWDGPGLGNAELVYHVANHPDSLTQEQTNAAIETALDAWASVADVSFTPTDQAGQRNSIDIRFTGIDGPGGTLAQAYFPDDVNPARIAGDIEFDHAENWEVGNDQGSNAFDLVLVAVHEIGHALGLDHSHAAGSALAPFVSPSQLFVGLGDVDRQAILGLYAAAEASSGTVAIGGDSSGSDPLPSPDEMPSPDEVPPLEMAPEDRLPGEEPNEESDEESGEESGGDGDPLADDKVDPWRWHHGRDHGGRDRWLGWRGWYQIAFVVQNGAMECFPGSVPASFVASDGE